jgi:crotonobetainyl-CoA:carnitine CoA-transferase CaiB-like acyl-CoA transferase
VTTAPNSNRTPLLIADFSRVLAGPFATMTLADFGAEVIKVERPEGDDTRTWGPPFAGGESTYFMGTNRNKHSIVLDLRDPVDRAVARRLCKRADVLVENFRPGTMARHGLDEPSLRADNPGLVYCSISAFGSGAGQDLAGYDLLVQALGGLMSITGPTPQQPTKVGVAVVDVLAGLFATVGILTALRERERSGLGQHVEVNLLSTMLSALTNQASGYVLAGHIPATLGNGHPSIAPYDTYATADGALVLAVGNDRQFAQLAEVLGAPELTTDSRFLTNQARVRSRDDLRTELERRLSSRPATAWGELLADRGVPAGAVNDLAGAFALAEKLGLAPVRHVEDEPGPLGAQVANPISLSATPATYRTHPPRLGEHSTAIRQWLDDVQESPLVSATTLERNPLQ